MGAWIGQKLGLFDVAGKLKPVPFIQASFALLLGYFVYASDRAATTQQLFHEKQLDQQAKTAVAVTEVRDGQAELRRSVDRNTDLIARTLIDVKRDTKEIKSSLRGANANAEIPPPRTWQPEFDEGRP